MLLNKELPLFIEAARAAFPQSNIRIVTNGLLFLKSDEQLLCAIQDNKAAIDVSLYPPTNKIKEKLEQLFDGNGIKYSFSPYINEFMDFYNDAGDSDIEESFSACGSKTCHFLGFGKIAVCPRPFVFEFDPSCDDQKRMEMRDYMIDLYDESIDGQKILDSFSKPIRVIFR